MLEKLGKMDNKLTTAIILTFHESCCTISSFSSDQLLVCHEQWYFSFKNQFSFSYRFMCHRFFSVSIVFQFWKSFPLQFQLSVFKSLIFQLQFQFLFPFQGLLYWSTNQWHSSY